MKKCVALAAFAFLFGYSSASVAGLTFRIVMSDGSKTTSEMRVWIDDNRMKTEIIEGTEDNPMMPQGSYMLMSEQGTYLVNPEARAYARFDMSMMQGITDALAGPGSAGALEFADVSVEKTIDEAGETIEGYPTRHYQLTSSWSMRVAGSPMTTSFSSVQDIWATDQIALPAYAGMALDRSALPQAIQEVADAQGARDVAGFPLRTITQQDTKTDMGIKGVGGKMAQRMMNRTMVAAGGGNTTTRVEAVDIQQADIPAGTFDLPADYTEMQLFQTGPDVPDVNSVPN